MHAWKACVLLQVPRVRIPLSPPFFFIPGKMSYQVLSLKYRPQTFNEVIGQSHVTQTLTNAILSDRVAHAILFAGPRGTGKTSIARILAKAMNCTSGPVPVPCNNCKSCNAITSGNSVDVFEIDGASNNSVDQIRELRGNITYLPSMSPFKIYIIDEVHMLSTAAFNALLKTLEEPPDHVLFIFATTEPHKIPVTILSRCQRHDLGRIPLSKIADQLESICKKEGYTIQRESIDIIASEADGSMRDSLSLLDRIMSSTGEKDISHETILSNLGIIDKKILFDISKAVIDLNGAAILEQISKVHDLGLDLKKFYSDIIKQFRNLAVIKICEQNKQFTEISNADRTIMEKMVGHLSKGYLTQILNMLIREESTIKFASHTKIALEMTLLNLLQIRKGIDIDDIISQLDFLVKNSAADKNFSINKQSMQKQPETAVNSSGIIEMESAESKPQIKQTATKEYHTDKNSVKNPDRNESRENNQPEKKQSENGPAENGHAENKFDGNLSGKYPSAEKQTVKQDHVSEAENKNSYGEKNWDNFVNEVRKDFPFVAVVLSKVRLKEITETEMVIEGRLKPKDLSRIESRMEELKQAAKQIFKKTLTIKILNPAPQVKPSEPEDTKREKTPAQARKKILNHPLVAEAIKMFNGSIVDIKTQQ